MFSGICSAVIPSCGMTDKFQTKDGTFKILLLSIGTKECLLGQKGEEKMEKRLVLLIVVMVAILAFAGVAKGGEFTITGYEPKKFAVTDDIKRQVDEEILASIERDPDNKPGTVLKVLVIGSADVTGISAENDPLSDNRAKPVAAILRHQLPLGTIIDVVPRGDTENERQVRVEWNFVSIPKPEPAPAPVIVTVVPPSGKSENLILLSAAFAILIVVAIIFFRTATRRSEKKTVAPVKDSEVPVIEYFPYSMDGVNYSVRVERKGKIYILPFRMFSDAAMFQTKDNKDDVPKTIRWYFKNWKKGKNPFAKEVNELIKKGVIKIS